MSVTPEEVYETLIKRDPEAYKDLRTEDITVSDKGAVRVNGRFVKGFTANPTGRPRKKEVTKTEDLTPAEIAKFGKNAKKALEHMLETASSRKEVKEISKILISYQSPKLANVESRTTEEKTIEIKWSSPEKDLIDLDPTEYEIQEQAARALLGQEVVDSVEKEVDYVESDKED